MGLTGMVLAAAMAPIVMEAGPPQAILGKDHQTLELEGQGDMEASDVTMTKMRTAMPSLPEPSNGHSSSSRNNSKKAQTRHLTPVQMPAMSLRMAVTASSGNSQPKSKRRLTTRLS